MHAKTREPWIDAVRAIAVVLVVLFHFLLWGYRVIAGPDPALAGVWGSLQEVLARIRIPLLMAVSGFLASSAIQRGWVPVRLRFLSNYWVYVVWLTIYWLFFTTAYRLIPNPDLPEAVNTVERYLQNLVMPNTVLWFVVAMAVFPVLVWLCEKFDIPVWLVILAAVAVWAWGTYGSVPQWFGKYARTFIFFAIGYYGRGFAPKLAGLGWPSAIVAVGAFVLSSIYLRDALEVQLGVTIAAVIGVVAVVIAGPQLFKSGLHARVASAVGKRTLEIYVLHVPLLGVMMLLLRDNAVIERFASTVWGDAIFVVGAVSLIVAVSLVLGMALRRVPGMMSLPKSWQERLTRQ